MKSIMLATDFSERSDRALRRATLLAGQYGASLSIVHVVDDDQPRRIIDAEQKVASRLLQELRTTVTDIDGIACTAEVLVAAPYAGIRHAVEQAEPDLLVIGPHRRQALRDVFIGTTAERTIRSIECPVIMVNAPPVGAYNRLLLTTDLSEGARHAVRRFEMLGIDQRTRVAMLHVFDAPALRLAMSHTMGSDESAAYIADERKIAARALSAFAGSVGRRNVAQILRHAERTPAQEILRAAEAEETDLIVVGTQGKRGFQKFVLGSVAEEVLRVADRDVLAVPSKLPADQETGGDGT